MLDFDFQLGLEQLKAEPLPGPGGTLTVQEPPEVHPHRNVIYHGEETVSTGHAAARTGCTEPDMRKAETSDVLWVVLPGSHIHSWRCCSRRTRLSNWRATLSRECLSFCENRLEQVFGALDRNHKIRSLPAFSIKTDGQYDAKQPGQNWRCVFRVAPQLRHVWVRASGTSRCNRELSACGAAELNFFLKRSIAPWLLLI